MRSSSFLITALLMLGGCATVGPEFHQTRAKASIDLELCMVAEAGFDNTFASASDEFRLASQEEIKSRGLDCAVHRPEMIRLLSQRLREEHRRYQQLRYDLWLGIRRGFFF
jgi:hypothetical protein